MELERDGWWRREKEGWKRGSDCEEVVTMGVCCDLSMLN